MSQRKLIQEFISGLEDIIFVEEFFEAIISFEDFEKAREVVKVTRAKSSSKGKNSILTDYLECGCCGGKLTKGKAANHNFLCEMPGIARIAAAKLSVKGQELSEIMMSELIRKVIIAPDEVVEICWRYRDELLGENPTAVG